MKLEDIKRKILGKELTGLNEYTYEDGRYQLELRFGDKVLNIGEHLDEFRMLAFVEDDVFLD